MLPPTNVMSKKNSKKFKEFLSNFFHSPFLSKHYILIELVLSQLCFGFKIGAIFPRNIFVLRGHLDPLKCFSLIL